MLLVLHTALDAGVDTAFARALMLAHLGLFFLWQPVWQRDQRLDIQGIVVILLLSGSMVVLLSWPLVFAWLTLLIGILAGRSFSTRQERYVYLFSLAFVVAAPPPTLLFLFASFAVSAPFLWAVRRLRRVASTCHAKWLAETRRCIESVLADPDRPAGRVIVIDDASPEPRLAAWLRGVAKSGRIELQRNARDLFDGVGDCLRRLRAADGCEIADDEKRHAVDAGLRAQRGEGLAALAAPAVQLAEHHAEAQLPGQGSAAAVEANTDPFTRLHARVAPETVPGAGALPGGRRSSGQVARHQK